MASEIRLAIHDDLGTVEERWRQFERDADCTVFQAFDWLAAWQRHIGTREGVTPAIVVGTKADGDLLFILPLAVAPGLVRRLTFLGCELCDYNAPLLAADFTGHVPPERFRALWDEIRALLQAHPRHRHDIVELAKMPETVGAQANPFLALDVGLNPSGAHIADLIGTWDEFYQAKRSSATRRRDRSKVKRLGEFGEVRFVTPAQPDELASTLDTLFAQKAKSLARMGVANVFARPGYREFFCDLALGEGTSHLVHVSRLDVGSIAAAVNLGLTFRDSYYHVIASYDDGDVSRFGPGAAHLRDLLSHALARGCRHFDFTIGDERYKLEWSDRTLSLYDHVAPATWRGWPLAEVMLLRRRVKRMIKQNPWLWSAFHRLRSSLGAKAATTGTDEGARSADTKSPDVASPDGKVPDSKASEGKAPSGKASDRKASGGKSPEGKPRDSKPRDSKSPSISPE
jgi:CelD/BcsL family acetyltransferase involved in cellulose biosynthesis